MAGLRSTNDIQNTLEADDQAITSSDSGTKVSLYNVIYKLLLNQLTIKIILGYCRKYFTYRIHNYFKYPGIPYGITIFKQYKTGFTAM